MFVIFSWNAYVDKPNIFRMVVLLCFVAELASYMAFYNDPLFYIKRWRVTFEKPEGFFIPVSFMLLIGVVLVINGFLDQFVFK